jgi:serine/threonine protein kinase
VRSATDARPSVWLADFGSARSPGGYSDFVGGTAGFTAPELRPRYGGDVKLTFKADVYSLGATVYFMLTKQTYARGARAWSAAVWREHPRVKELAQGMLAENPSDRLALADVAEHSWLMEEKVIDDGTRNGASLASTIADGLDPSTDEFATFSRE